MFNPPKINIYGTGTIGARGQIVIPAKARNELKIKPNDEFIFFGHGPLIHLVKAHQLDNILNQMTKRYAQGISKIKQIRKKI
jgi:AbrB family looped-hinge helix DNA binding protein